MLRRFISLFIPLLFTLAFANSSIAESERITNFQSDITVNQDASIDVKETISVYANQNRIVHGIVRRLPTRYIDSYGIARYTNYDIGEILLNGKNSDFHLDRKDNQRVIYIGERDITLSPGIYNYTINYHVNNAVNFLRDGDEIYWNITGNSWDFPIDKAEVNITLPKAADISNYAGYTGPKGAKEKDYTVDKLAQNQIQFTTTKILLPNEGFTVAAAWQKGIIHQPTWWEWIMQQLHTAELALIGLTLAVCIYYLYVWYLHGIGPRPGTIIPLYEPPNQLTPESMRYIMRMGFDDKAFSAAIVNMAASGYLTIENKKDVFTLTKKNDAKALQATEEIELGDKLFSSGNTVKVSQTNHDIMQKARSNLYKNLQKNYLNKYFVTNRSYLIPGWIMTGIAFYYAVSSADNAAVAAFLLVWLSAWTAGCATLVAMAFYAIEAACSLRSVKTIIGAIFASLFALPFLGGEVMGIFMLSMIVPIFTIPMLFLIMVLNVIFFHILKAPTTEGRLLMDKIEGFKLFFTTTERYRIEQMYPGKKTPEVYEKYLPYAIALDMESEWTAQFEEVLRNAGKDPATYHPAWYSGQSAWSSQNMGAMPLMLGTALASSLASASVSSSSSGSGGGGSSGGGGGGGGGGGW